MRVKCLIDTSERMLAVYARLASAGIATGQEGTATASTVKFTLSGFSGNVQLTNNATAYSSMAVTDELLHTETVLASGSATLATMLLIYDTVDKWFALISANSAGTAGSFVYFGVTDGGTHIAFASTTLSGKAKGVAFADNLVNGFGGIVVIQTPVNILNKWAERKIFVVDNQSNLLQTSTETIDNGSGNTITEYSDSYVKGVTNVLTDSVTGYLDVPGAVLWRGVYLESSGDIDKSLYTALKIAYEQTLGMDGLPLDEETEEETS